VWAAPATVHKCHQCLSKILAAAVDARMLHHNPADRVPLPRITQHEMRHLDPDELAALTDAIHPRYRALVLVSGYCGLRIGEIAGLRRRRVDLLRRRIEVAEIAVEVRGHVQFGQPKTAAGHRTVPFPRFLTHELAEHLGRWPQPGSEGLVFTGPEGGVLRVPAFRRRMWLPAVERAGLAPLRIHDLRHTAVSLWIAAGVDVKTIAVRAGHTLVRTVLDRYGHLRDREDDPALDALDAMHASARPRMEEIVIELLG
jgi:integrase